MRLPAVRKWAVHPRVRCEAHGRPPAVIAHQNPPLHPAAPSPATRLYEGTPFAAGPAWCEPTSLPLLQLLAATASVTGTVTFLADPFAKGYLGAGFDSAGP